MDIGSGPTAVGFGKATSHGRGPAIIMAGGSKTRPMDGSGFRVSSGRRHGSPGVLAVATAVGLLCHRVV